MSLTSYRGWESIPHWVYPTMMHLQAESLMLTRLYSSTFNVSKFKTQPTIPTISFFHMKFERGRQCQMSHDQFPDVLDLFKSLTPIKPKIYSTFSYQDPCCLQSQNKLKYLICFDTGCSLSTNFSLDGFEQPLLKGSFGQLCSINGIVPIQTAGIIKWTVMDLNGNDTIL